MDTSFKQGRAEDRAMIQAVVNRYAHTARDKMDFADVIPLFSANSTIVLPGGTKTAKCCAKSFAAKKRTSSDVM